MSERAARRNPSKRAVQVSVLALTAAVVVTVFGLAVLGRGSTEERPAGKDASVVAAQRPAEALGARVEFPSSNRGRLPLDTTVTQTYEVVNTGTQPIQLGRPSIEVIEGCCPPIPTVSKAVLAPGEAATVSMSMQMHEGMDGPHLFHLTVGVTAGEDQDALHLYFEGDFRG